MWVTTLAPTRCSLESRLALSASLRAAAAARVPGKTSEKPQKHATHPTQFFSRRPNALSAVRISKKILKIRRSTLKFEGLPGARARASRVAKCTRQRWQIRWRYMNTNRTTIVVCFVWLLFYYSLRTIVINCTSRRDKWTERIPSEIGNKICTHDRVSFFLCFIKFSCFISIFLKSVHLSTHTCTICVLNVLTRKIKKNIIYIFRAK